MRTSILRDIESVIFWLLVTVIGIIAADRQLVPEDREQLHFFELVLGDGRPVLHVSGWRS